MKIGNITFKFDVLSSAFAMLGFIFLFVTPVYGVALIGAAILMSSDWRHRQIAQAAIWITFLGVLLVTLHAWLYLVGFAIGGFLVYKKIPHALSYTCWLTAVAALFAGSWLLTVIAAATGFLVWKFSR